MLKPRDAFTLWLLLMIAAIAPSMFFATAGLAQDEPPPADGMTLLQQLVVVIIPVVSSIILQAIKKLAAQIPTTWLPILAPIVGVIIQGIALAFGGDVVPGVDGLASLPVAAALGMTAVGGNQIVKKALGEPPVEPPAPRSHHAKK